MTVSGGRVAILGLAGLLAAGAIVSGQRAAGSKEKEKVRPPARAMRPAQPAPPDGVWLKDAEGREYFLEKLPKAQAKKIADGSYRSVWGIPIDVEKEDEAFYYYKVYKTVHIEPTEPEAPSPEALKAIEATYRSSLKASTRFRFAAFSSGLPVRGQWRDRFDVADINGDGAVDIVHGPPRKSLGPPVIWLGDGKGQWRRWQEVRFPPLPYDYGDAKVADFNGDGRLDIALGVHLRGLAVVFGSATGGFEPSGPGLDLDPQKAGFTSKTLAVADWNRDGRPDLLALGEGPGLATSRAGGPSAPSSTGVVVFLSRADGSWERRTGRPTQIFGDALEVADVNGDGRLDIVTGTSAMGQKTIVNLGDESGGWASTAENRVRPGAIVRGVAAADINGDGRGEVVLGYLAHEGGEWRTGIDLLATAADDTGIRTTLFSEPGPGGISAVDAGDIDADGHIDLAAITGDGRLLTFRGDGAGGFTRDRTQASLFAEPCAAASVRLADLNGDGRADVVASFAEEPTSDPLTLSMNVKPRCPGQGGLAAWISVRPAAAPAKQTPARKK